MAAYSSAGKTTLTPDVLSTIARMATLEVEGVSRMAPVKNKAGRLFRGGHEGVRLAVEDNIVMVDLYVVLEKDVNLREVGRDVQEHVARAIAEMTGLEVGQINIHIEDVDYGASEG